MEIKHSEIEIPLNEPFKNCKLKRSKYSEVLTDIISTYADGFVLAIDSKWGTGKTTFVKMWRQHLENQGFKTLYFNAWVNDFESNPLVAILSELKTLNPSDESSHFKSLLAKGAIITQNLAPALIKAIAKKYIDFETLADAVKEIAKSATEILKDEIDEYAKKKKGLIDFKDDLEKYIKTTTETKPLVFIIDELDRCRPTYAVEVLEQVKHFFSVNGIVFVLAIDKEQLGNAIKGFYGSDFIDSNEYLRRFIDIEYNIPEPSAALFCDYLFEYFQFDNFFLKTERRSGRQDDKDLFLEIAKKLFEKDNITLRQQAKIFAHARLALNMVHANQNLYPELFFILTYLRDQKRELYLNIRGKNLTPQQLINNLITLLPQETDSYGLNNSVYVEAQFAIFYDNYYKKDHSPSNLYKKDRANGKYELLVNSSFGVDANSVLLGAFENYDRSHAGNTKLSVILNKIDLLENIIK